MRTIVTTEHLYWIALKTKSGETKPLSSWDTTRVARINPGWLFKFRHFHGSSSSLTTQAMTFIPDFGHEWYPENNEEPWERISRKKNPNYGEYTDRLKIWNGWIYKDSFFNGNKEMHISLVYVPDLLRENNNT